MSQQHLTPQPNPHATQRGRCEEFFKVISPTRTPVFLFFRLVPLSFLTRASCKRALTPRILVFKVRMFLYGRFQKSKGCAAVRALASHQFGPGSDPGVDAIRGLSLLFVLSLASRGFSPGFPVFPSPQKPALPDSNSILNARTHYKRVVRNFLSVSWVNKLQHKLQKLQLSVKQAQSMKIFPLL